MTTMTRPFRGALFSGCLTHTESSESAGRGSSIKRWLRSVAAALVATSGLFFASPASADILHVPADFPTIQGAINASVDTDEIIVAPGVYHEAISFVGKAITLRGAQGPHVTIIDATGLGESVVRCINEEGPETVLNGFTLAGGTGTSYAEEEPSGGGLLVFESSPTVMNCRFVDNTAHFGGGIYNWGGAATILNCTFLNNSGNGGGVANHSSGPVPIINCLFVENNGTAVVDFLGGGPALITNCTIVGNSDGGSAGGVFSFGAQLYNCVVWGNTPYQIEGFGKVVAEYSNIQGGWPGDGNIDADPLFVDAGLGDHRLMSGSPCIDAGDNDALPLDQYDLDEDGDTMEPLPFDLGGNTRLVDDPNTKDTGVGRPPIVDMGAYEFQGAGCPWDLNDDGVVGTDDLIVLLGAWGKNPGHPADLDGDGNVDTSDLIELLGNWGPCP